MRLRSKLIAASSIAFITVASAGAADNTASGGKSAYSLDQTTGLVSVAGVERYVAIASAPSFKSALELASDKKITAKEPPASMTETVPPTVKGVNIALERGTTITKTTTDVGQSSQAVNRVDANIVFEGDGWTFDGRGSRLLRSGAALGHGYGLYFGRVANPWKGEMTSGVVQNFAIVGADVGIAISPGAIQSKIDNGTIFGGSKAIDIPYVNGTTSTTISGVFGQRQSVCTFCAVGLEYSTLDHNAADAGGTTADYTRYAAYNFRNSLGLSFNGNGAEGFHGSGYRLLGSTAVINGGFMYAADFGYGSANCQTGYTSVHSGACGWGVYAGYDPIYGKCSDVTVNNLFLSKPINSTGLQYGVFGHTMCGSRAVFNGGNISPWQGWVDPYSTAVFNLANKTVTVTNTGMAYATNGVLIYRVKTGGTYTVPASGAAKTNAIKVTGWHTLGGSGDNYGFSCRVTLDSQATGYPQAQSGSIFNVVGEYDSATDRGIAATALSDIVKGDHVMPGWTITEGAFDVAQKIWTLAVANPAQGGHKTVVWTADCTAYDVN